MFLCSQNSKKYHYRLLTGGKVSQGWPNKIQRKKLPPSLSHYTLRFVPFYWLHRSKEAAPNMWITNLKFTFIQQKVPFTNPWADDGRMSLFLNFTLLLYIIIIQLLLAFFRPALKYAVNTIYQHIYIIYIYFYRHTYSHICSTIEITVLHKYSVSQEEGCTVYKL